MYVKVLSSFSQIIVWLNIIDSHLTSDPSVRRLNRFTTYPRLHNTHIITFKCAFYCKHACWVLTVPLFDHHLKVVFWTSNILKQEVTYAEFTRCSIHLLFIYAKLEFGSCF